MSLGEQNSKPDLYVIARIIKALKEKNRKINRTALATATGLSYDALVKYLAWMLERQFVEIDEDGYVTLTKAGAKSYDDFVSWILKYVGQLKFSRFNPRV
jgi:predicted transcriptional regulator